MLNGDYKITYFFAATPFTRLDRSFQITVLTHLTSPYQVELFDAVSEQLDGQLRVVYLHSKSLEREWRLPVIHHSNVILDRDPSEIRQVTRWLTEPSLVVFNVYSDPIAKDLLRVRAASRHPWCFWGERPGFRGKGWLGRLYRRWRLAALHRTQTPIWCIGSFAIEQYCREFGADRKYINLPYFSNLTAFFANRKPDRRQNFGTRFLFSGSLIERKGVDLLARAFVRLALERSDISLRWLGAGPLRLQLESQCNPVSNRVTFAGFVDWSGLPTAYQQGDVLCVPSRYDGWGLVVPEGLAGGIPVIASNQTGSAIDLIRHRENGWIIQANSEQALYNALREACELDDKQFDGMAIAARASVKRHTLADGAQRFIAAAEQTETFR